MRKGRCGKLQEEQDEEVMCRVKSGRKKTFAQFGDIVLLLDGAYDLS